MKWNDPAGSNCMAQSLVGHQTWNQGNTLQCTLPLVNPRKRWCMVNVRRKILQSRRKNMKKPISSQNILDSVIMKGVCNLLLLHHINLAVLLKMFFWKNWTSFINLRTWRIWAQCIYWIPWRWWGCYKTVIKKNILIGKPDERQIVNEIWLWNSEQWNWPE